LFRHVFYNHIKYESFHLFLLPIQEMCKPQNIFHEIQRHYYFKMPHLVIKGILLTLAVNFFLWKLEVKVRCICYSSELLEFLWLKFLIWGLLWRSFMCTINCFSRLSRIFKYHCRESEVMWNKDSKTATLFPFTEVQMLNTTILPFHSHIPWELGQFITPYSLFIFIIFIHSVQSFSSLFKI